MNSAIAPQAPVENWQQVRDEWIAEVEHLATDVERWSAQNDWDTKREMKEIVEHEIGAYQVPVIRIQTMQGRIYFDPTARFIVGAAGRIEIVATPLFFQLVMVKVDGKWRFFSEEEMEDLGQSWTHEGFTQVVMDLLKRR
jgi:hypothetical protein